MNCLTRFAWSVLAYNVAVVLFGAVVRATGSGAGCANDWPVCRGALVPEGGAAETIIEYSHRVTAGLALILVAVLAVWVWRVRPRGDAVRRAAVAAAIFIVAEALIGAALVVFEWVADDQSTGRALSAALHLVNTFLLLGTLTLVAWWLTGGRVPGRRRGGPDSERRWLLAAALGMCLVGAAGAVTALGDTLFPAESVFAGISDDFTGSFLVRLRWIHPVVAVTVSALMLWLVARLDPGEGWGRRAADLLRALVLVQLGAGALNVILLAPLWMQVVHLLLADAAWIGFVVFAVEARAESAARLPDTARV